MSVKHSIKNQSNLILPLFQSFHFATQTVKTQIAIFNIQVRNFLIEMGHFKIYLLDCLFTFTELVCGAFCYCAVYEQIETQFCCENSLSIQIFLQNLIPLLLLNEDLQFIFQKVRTEKRDRGQLFEAIEDCSFECNLLAILLIYLDFIKRICPIVQYELLAKIEQSGSQEDHYETRNFLYHVLQQIIYWVILFEQTLQFLNRSQKHKRQICLRSRMIADEQNKSEVPSYILSVAFSVCCLVQPFNPFSLHPFSQTLLSGNKIILASSVLLAVLPSTDILSSIWPMESSSSMLFVIDVLTLIFSSIGPLGLSVAVHLVVLPLALVFSVLAPDINTQVNEFLPFPWIQLLRNYPSQQLVSKNLRIPLPVFVPFLYYPSYFSPSGHYYTPNPFCLSSFHSPTYLAPLEWVYVPYPLALSLSHYPQQISPSEWQRIPFPLALLLVHQPTYLLPSAQVWVPLPSLIPFFHQPQQVMPLSSSTGPGLVIQSPLKVDWMSWLSFWVLPRSSKFPLLSSNLRFLQVYGSACFSLLYFSPAAAAAQSYYFCSSFKIPLSGLSLLVYFAGSCSFLAYSCGTNSSFYTVLQLQFSLSKTSAFRLFQICFFSLGLISSGDFSTFAQAPIQTPISLQKLYDQ